MKTYSVRLALAGVLAGALAFSAVAQQKPVGDIGTVDLKEGEKLFKKPGFSPYAGRNYPTVVYWGDTHLHTSMSLDARAGGNTLGPEEALRFARGGEVVAATGEPARLSRPLDWLVVADHSDAMGTMNEIAKGNPQLMTDPTVKQWHDAIAQGGEVGMQAAYDVVETLSAGKIPPVMLDPRLTRSLWERQTAIIEKYNEPGRFTAFIGYEWTSNNTGNNLHRNVIYRDGKAKADQAVPFTTAESENPEDLWKWMQAYEEKSGGSVLAIPHNGNLSNGLMFKLETFKGTPLTKEWATARANWEPLYETTQIKGDGESHPSLSPSDEFAAYETWDKGNLMLLPKKPGMLQYEYTREALKNGLKIEQQFGVNPFKFGLVGSTDSHTSLSTAEEENFFGKHSGVEPNPHRYEHVVMDFQGRKLMSWEMAASGYAGVWSTENTREALWDAMKRREVYATTGPRMIVRFFGGFDFVAKDATSRLPAEIGYAKGVPMGGDLHRAPAGKAPTFLVAALKDPIGANLDRLQVVKGWLDAKGDTHEKVYDVAWGDAATRRPGPDGKLPPVGNTVDVKDASWTNTIGDPELITVWKDPDFDPSLRAFYYVRVLEIPTPRWTAYEAKRFGITMPKEVPMVTQERAYTSPIWYTPGQ
ncbi:MAG: hypothetical protein H6Q08_1609 [Acidobacteria bacterium]|nr:hypothetical protein [Acidobacteriota bacterium]